MPGSGLEPFVTRSERRPAGHSAIHMAAFYDLGARTLRHLYDRKIRSAAVLDTAALFPDARRFTAAWRTLRDEALDVARDLPRIPRFHEIMREQADISANDARDWRMFILQAYGVGFEKNRVRCPALAAIVDATPDVLSASLSFLAPGKHIPPHRGPFRGVLRGYLVLSMPKRDDGSPAAVLKIDGRDHRLDDGQFLLWDDTFEHEVWNDSDSVRIVLLLDIRRRDLPPGLRLLSAAIVRLIQVGIRLRGGSIPV
ncbi:aspartyl/asparaginyl beta-hydroxylase domain-containing protein [Burkholderia sp. 3C]